MEIDQGCEVYLQCDAPPGSGLGTSSTVMVALLIAMARWKGVEMDGYALADLAYGVEREDLNIDGGYQDQYASTFGGFNFIEFHGRNNVVVNPLRIKKDIIHELQYNLLLCYTGKIHVSANIIRDQVDNYKKTGSEITKKQIEEEKKRLESLTASLIEQTSTTEEMTPELVAAWKTLATLSYDEYSAVISNMEPDMQEKIQKATEIIVNGTPYAGQVASEYGKTIVQNLDKNEEFRRQAISSLNAYLSGLTDEEQKELIKQAGVKEC